MQSVLPAPTAPWWLRLWRWLTGEREAQPPSTAIRRVAGPPAPTPNRGAVRAVGEGGAKAPASAAPVRLTRVPAPWELAEAPPGRDPEAVRPAVVGRLWYAVSEAPPEVRPFLERLARDLDASTVEFPLFPDAALRLDRFLRSGEPTVHAVSAIIHDEPELVRRVWEAGRGAAYGSRQAKTLDEAIVRLGLDAVWRVAMGACVHSPVFRVPAFQVQCEEIRAAAPVVGSVANVLAPGGDAWLAGLLHGMGRLLVYRAASARSRTPVDRSRVEDTALRLAPGIAMLIAANWGLRPGVVQALGWFPEPDRAPLEHREAAVAVRAAVLAVYQIGAERRGLDYGAREALRCLPTRAYTPERVLEEAEAAWQKAHPPRGMR